jgi:predicted PurR-regulated permease PerM
LAHGWLDNISSSLVNVSSSLPTAASNIVSSIFNFFGGVFSFILVLVITFYMVAEENVIRKLIWSLTPEDKQTYVMDVFKRIQIKLGLWLRGQLILCLVIFVLTYIGLTILGVKYALVLALIAGVTEFIPYLGPIIGGIPAVFLAFTQSPMLALFTIILYVVVQQIENNLLVPKIMEKAVGLNPIASIIVLMIGFSVGGVMGAILSIPVATAASVVIEDFLHKKKVAEMAD